MKLFEVITGIETYEIPEVHGFIMIECRLESLEDIISEKTYDTVHDKSGKTVFSTSGFTKAIQEGFIPAVECFFVDKRYLLGVSLEYEALRLKRMNFITSALHRRILSEFEAVYAESKEKILHGDREFSKLQWKDRAYKKIYCMYQLDSAIKMFSDKDIPGEPMDFIKYPDLSLMDRKIELLKTEFEGLSTDIKHDVDKFFIIRTLRTNHLYELKKTVK